MRLSNFFFIFAKDMRETQIIMKQTLLLFLTFSLAFSAFAERKERYYFSQLSLNEGLSQITVLCSWQDSMGFIWFGTRNGLNRYDGYGFNVFQNDVNDSTSISDNHILCITGDKNENLWVGTNNGLNKLDLSTNTFKHYFHDSSDKNSISHNTIHSLFVDEDKRLWVGTGCGLNLYDPKSDSFKLINPDNLFTDNPINIMLRKGDSLFLATTYMGLIYMNVNTFECTAGNNENSHLNNYIRAMYMDKNNNLWMGTYGDGVYELPEGGSQYIYYNKSNGLTDNYIRCINESPDGSILVGTFNGLNVINPETEEITLYNTYDVSHGDLSHYSVYSILFDRSGTLWIGTYAGGINYYSPLARSFKLYDPVADNKVMLGIFGPILEYNSCLYIATEGGGLLEYNMKTESFHNYLLTSNNHIAYGMNILKSLYRDGNDILCGTNVGSIYAFNPNTKKMSLKYKLVNDDPIYVLQKDSSGCLIAGGVNLTGLLRIKPDGTMQNHFPVEGRDDFTFSNVRTFLEIRKNVCLIGTRSDGLFKYDANNKTLVQYEAHPGNTHPKSLPENYISSIYRDSKNNIWIGTFGGGFCLFDLDKEEFTTFGTEQELLNNNVCSIVESLNGHLWISSIDGISDFNPKDLTFKNYSHSNGITIHEFSPHSSVRTSSGEIFFSGNNGFLSFNPNNLSHNPNIPPIVFDEIFVNNERIIPGGKNGILDKRIGWKKSITLKYNQSNISIQYCALNFIFPERNQYSYKMEGFDKSWNAVGNRRIAYYTNIPPGKYIFKVKGSNNDGVWNETGASLEILILPPFWKTIWAYLIYTSIILLVITMIFRYFRDKAILQNEIRLKQIEANAREKFHQDRDRLFTNFSHELRTPLTLIISPIEDIIENEDLSPNMRNRVMLMRGNSRRLLRLVNNLMDFQKQESGTLQLRVAEDDIIKFIEEMHLVFNELAISRNIRFNFIHPDKTIQTWYDSDLIEKVCFNFFSNAFKNTPDGGSIEIRMDLLNLPGLKKRYPLKSATFRDEGSNYLTLEIENSGEGIPADDLENIFTPFFQVAQSKHARSGTGLGLSLSRSIIEMHHGVVWAESVENQGAIFKVILPVGQKYFTESEIAEGFKDSENIAHYEIDIPEKAADENPNRKKKPYTVLVVEDNPDIRHYILSLLVSEYNVLEASNGVESIEKSLQHLPDLIISDLMMPKMDGIEMCSKLKNDQRTSHIPIILITAKTTAMDIQEGYESGADDYIIKPFNASVLISRVKNILRTREKLKDLYSKRFSISALGIEVSSMDEKFMQKLYNVMSKNVANPELNLDNFCRDIGMSRANLYRKIKSLTGLSPNEFIRNFRLEMAAKILKEANIPISELYVAVGFNSHPYFCNCFKAMYGVSPTEYVNAGK